MAGNHIQLTEPLGCVNRHFIVERTLGKLLQRDASTEPFQCFPSFTANPLEAEATDQHIQRNPELDRRAMVVSDPLPCPLGCKTSNLHFAAGHPVGCAHFGNRDWRGIQHEHPQTLAGVADP
ncbi:MAG: Uncharacterised protein [Cyanobium sp. ARS6]|nr:MAG: Uncharacterised protein [Cyanobium sp. ARS6]